MVGLDGDAVSEKTTWPGEEAIQLHSEFGVVIPAGCYVFKEKVVLRRLEDIRITRMRANLEKVRDELRQCAVECERCAARVRCETALRMLEAILEGREP